MLIIISLVILYFYSYRIENIFNENIQQMPKDIKQYTLYNKLIQAIYVHRRAIELVLVYIILLHSKPILPGQFSK